MSVTGFCVDFKSTQVNDSTNVLFPLPGQKKNLIATPGKAISEGIVVSSDN